MKRLPLLVAAAGLTVAGLTACAGSSPTSYAPAAYGTNGQCYYVDSPAEVLALQNAGLCPRNWVPTLMPVAWHEMYYPYYSSPAYSGRYVPASARASYVRSERSFGSTYHSAIATQSKRGAYRGSDGKVVSGTTVIKKGKTTFGSGTVGTQLGGGSRNKQGTSYGNGGGSRSRSGTSGGTSGRSGGGSIGGGSRSGGGKR